MSRTHRSCRRDHFILPSLSLAALLIIAFTLSVLTSRRVEARAGGTRQPTNREASQKLQGSVDEVKDGFSVTKDDGFMRRAVANSRAAGVIDP